MRLPEGIVITFVNSLALLVFLSKTFRVNKSTYLLVNLTVADLLVGLTLIIIGSYDFGGDKKDNVLNMFSRINIVSAMCSLFTFTVIAVERAYAILAPYRHRQLGRRPYLCAIALAWVVPLGAYIGFIFESNGEIIQGMIALIFVISSLAVIMSCYLAIWIRVKFKRNFSNGRQNVSNTKLAVTLFLVTVASLLCYLPFSAILIHFIWIKMESSPIIDYFVPLLYANSFINFFFYSLRMPDFRRQLYKLIRQCFPVRNCTISKMPQGQDMDHRRDRNQSSTKRERAQASQDSVFERPAIIAINNMRSPRRYALDSREKQARRQPAVIAIKHMQ
ncbi:predicted protein [Nematostella vectensis]|uniref:G-protein coupled receptors family 1 profile domain-containing protein n=1 Tax=Nematostella vectensis TaxID=45351 RepID=A7RNG5_NEMVE|nr:predicted protein [Nematostella vectensis]|eukprot:XP_001639120.1 predicted protein [Nematostella vectensis]